MGIHGLYKLIKDNAPEAIEKITKEDLKGKVCAADANIEMCQALYSKNETSTADIIKRMKNKTKDLQKNGTICVWIFDSNTPPAETEDTRIARSNIREGHKTKSQDLAVEIKQHSDALQDLWTLQKTQQLATHPIQPTQEVKDEVKIVPDLEEVKDEVKEEGQSVFAEDGDQVFEIPSAVTLAPETNPLVKAAQLQEKMMKLMDKKQGHDIASQRLSGDASTQIREALQGEQILCYVSSRSADDLVAQLSRLGIADFVITEDSDAIAQRVKKTLRGVSDHFYYSYRLEKQLANGNSGGNTDQIVEDGKFIFCYNYDKVLAGLKLTASQFVDMCILLGHDNDPKIDGIGAVKALEFIRLYNDIDTIVQKIASNEIGLPKTKPRKRATPDAANAPANLAAIPEPPKNKFTVSEKFLNKYKILRDILNQAPCDNDLLEIQETIGYAKEALLLEQSI